MENVTEKPSPAALLRSCKALGSIVSLRHLIAEDCTQLSSRGIAALTGLTVRACRPVTHADKTLIQGV